MLTSTPVWSGVALGGAMLLVAYVLRRRSSLQAIKQDEKQQRTKEKNNKKTLVCVTGGTGFLGSWCVKFCLEKGYHVRVTTRHREKATFLLQHFKPAAEEGRLEIYDACGLTVVGSFDKAIEGCDAVLHTASPFYFKGATEEKMMEPAVKGTLSILDACNKYKVKKVALTSSTAAVYADFGGRKRSHVYTANDWSNAEKLRKAKQWYPLSKTVAEQKAWEHSKAEGCCYKLAVLCPTLIWGPMLDGQPHFNTSSSQLAVLLDGTKTTYENACKAIVDVRDVARCHVSLIEKDISWPGWGQRYLVMAECLHYSKVVNYIRSALPPSMQSKVPSQMSPKLGKAIFGPPPPHPVLFDSSPSLQLLPHNKYVCEEDIITGNVRSLLQNKFLHSSQYVPDR
eukprot:gb/GEZN01007314.1/.p1 GENE.gb/GEZN01007314.1/~~gb/GEZN01007314.1/.p1  ORF type:complete len:396 (-),score=69.38 gb/GEZN01007314.1/:335-1522(-)